MLALSFSFPAGRYHATPWDRHVNEGAVAWPPEPWRILRGLVATWHHKIRHSGNYDESTLRALIESLSKELPEYGLPAATHNHTRHYMPQFAAGATSLIFDAFMAVKRNDPLTVLWPNVELPDDQRELLDKLLSVIGYLGRAESWVEAKRLTEAPPANCVPRVASQHTEGGETEGEVLTLYAATPPADYQLLRQKFLADKTFGKKLAKTLPDNLLDALSVDTAELRKHGWNQPPAARKVTYLRRIDALRSRYAPRSAGASRSTTASFIVVGKPLPRVEETLRIGELMRMAVMSQAKRIYGEDRVPSILSGHGMPEGNRHGHAFYLPWNSNGDGCIDRILLYAPGGMGVGAWQILQGLRKLWAHDGSGWRLVLEHIDRPNAICPLTQSSDAWVSVTPYLHPWHVKKRFDAAAQIRRECRERGLPEPTMLSSVAELEVGKGRKRRPVHFRRFRSRGGLTQPDRSGSFWRLTFPEPVQGPLALGFACHFGLGLFTPIRG